MLRGNYLKLINNLQINPVRIFLYIFIFLQPFTYFTSLRQISFYCLLFFFLWKILKEKKFEINLKDSTFITLILLVFWILLVSIIGPYPLDSLNDIRKNIFIQILILLVIFTEFRDIRELKPLFFCIILSFIIVSLLSIFERYLSDIISFYQTNQKQKSFFADYGHRAIFYLPFTVAWLISLNHARIIKYLVGICILIEIYLVVIFNSRTALMAIPIGIFSMFLFSKKYKLLFISCLIFITFFSALYITESEKFSKYKTLLNIETYFTNQGLSNRLGVWTGALDVIKDRPLLGYGCGWKKMAWVVQNPELIQYWKENRPDTYNYYVIEANLTYGRVNPHNLIIQILFEIGLIGLILFVIFWITIIYKIFKIAFLHKGFNFEEKTFLRCSLGIVISYFSANITNGFWQESYGNMIFVFIASCLVIYRNVYKNFIIKN